MNIFDYRVAMESEWQDLTDFDCLEVKVFKELTDDINGGYIAEFLLTYGGPTVRLTIDSRWNCGELFHSWGVDSAGNKKQTINITKEVTDKFKELIESCYIQ